MIKIDKLLEENKEQTSKIDELLSNNKELLTKSQNRIRKH